MKGVGSWQRKIREIGLMGLMGPIGLIKDEVGSQELRKKMPGTERSLFNSAPGTFLPANCQLPTASHEQE